VPKKSKRGGARTGAGRPRKPDPITAASKLTVSLPPSMVAWVREVAARSETSVSDVVRLALDHLANDPAAAMKLVID
jgi:hypothetical protein